MAPRKKPLPTTDKEVKPLPSIGKPENTVKIGELMIEIKPTLFLYQRDRTAAFYKMLEMYPLPDLFAMTKEALGDEERDGDKCIMDWLIAAIDNVDLEEGEAEKIVIENFAGRKMDTGTLETILSIFKRVNKINEKEINLKKFKEQRGVMA